jgi:hypothetical protein
MLFFDFISVSAVFVGSFSVIRMFDETVLRFHVSKKWKWILRTTVFSVSLLSFLIFHPSLANILLFLLLAMIGQSLLNRFFIAFYEGKTRFEVAEFLVNIQMSMKTGFSFSNSVQDAKLSCEAFLQQSIDRMLDLAFVESAKPSSFEGKTLQDLFLLIRKSLHDPSHSLKQVESLRQQLKLQSEFRQRSGRAMTQAMIQILFMLGMYLAVTFLSWQSVPKEQLLPWLKISAPLFLAGLLTIAFLARSFKWKM